MPAEAVADAVVLAVLALFDADDERLAETLALMERLSDADADRVRLEEVLML